MKHEAHCGLTVCGDPGLHNTEMQLITNYLQKNASFNRHDRLIIFKQTMYQLSV